VGTLVLGSCLAICAAASAYAGNGNGKDNGNGNDAPAVAAQADEGHGNSAGAPGQVKKEEAAAEAQAQAQASVPAQQAPSGPAQGIKPSNDTAHDTHAAASSDKTKLYGNGATAGQIAIQNGAAPSLHGPGNSQPHKASPCAGGHEVDVHALKGKRSGSCGSRGPSPHPTPVPDPGPGPRTVTPPSSDPGSPPAAAGGPAPTGSVVGGVTSKPTHGSSGSSGSGFLGATGVLARGALPFTGLDLWSAVFVGATLILIGLALCRRARTVPVFESETEARP
jgi:hypothetical protein